MPTKIIKTGADARADFIKGVDLLGDIIQSTFGPHGQNWLLNKGDKITNDGRNIAVEIEHPEEIAQRALNTLRKAAIDTEKEVMDASTTAIILARAIFKSAIKQLPQGGAIVGKMTPSEILKKIEAERIEITEKLMAMANPIESLEQLVEAAVVSTEDSDLGILIGSKQWDLGKDGIMIAEETADLSCSIEHIQGIMIDNGFGTSSIINNAEKESLEVKSTKVILTNHVIQDLAILHEILTQLHKSGTKRLVIVARAFTEKAIRDCMENIKTGFEIYPINAPYTNQNEVMKDLVASLGGAYINLETMSLEDIQLSHVGFANFVTCERARAIFAGEDNEASKERIANRIKELEENFAGAKSPFEKKNIEQRIAQLSNGFSLVKIGSASDTDRKRLKDKADDAVGTVRMALQEGVVPGAGQAFKAIADDLPDSYLLKQPLLAPYQQIMSSAPEGFVIEEWVKDPVKTLRVALKYACSYAGNLATAFGADAIEKEKPRYVQEIKK